MKSLKIPMLISFRGLRRKTNSQQAQTLNRNDFIFIVLSLLYLSLTRNFIYKGVAYYKRVAYWLLYVEMSYYMYLILSKENVLSFNVENALKM